jgi:ribonuclease P protein component
LISKLHRFSGPSSIRYVLRKGKVLRGSYVNVRYIKNSRILEYRASVVVSKKVTKSAPKRNRIRRRVYEIIRLNAADYLSNQDLVVIVLQDSLATMPQKELEQIIIGYLQQIQKVS